jgi:hypothetical protein
MGSEKPRGIAAPTNPYTEPTYSDSRASFSLGTYGASQQPREDGSGYAVPEEQFNYDTSYRGGHEPGETVEKQKVAANHE